jgi:hypothetical protein
MVEDAGSGSSPPSRAALRKGTRVEVRSGLDGSWQSGFVIHSVDADGYVLRRESDAAVLPAIPKDRVRRPRRRQTWWV